MADDNASTAAPCGSYSVWPECGRCGHVSTLSHEDASYCERCGSCGECGCCPCCKPECDWCASEKERVRAEVNAMIERTNWNAPFPDAANAVEDVDEVGDG